MKKILLILFTFSFFISEAQISTKGRPQAIDTSARPRFKAIRIDSAATLPTSTSIGSVTSVELSRISGLLSPVQTQINTKSPTASPTFTGTVSLPATTSIGSVSDTELGYVDGVTSPIQTQISNKVDKIIGKGLSQEDYTTDEKNKLAGLASGQVFKGSWNASTNSPTLMTTPSANGDYYIVSVTGTQGITGSSIVFYVGDKIISNGTSWVKVTYQTLISDNYVNRAMLNDSNKRAIDGIFEVRNSAFTQSKTYGRVPLVTTGVNTFFQSVVIQNDGIENIAGTLSSFSANIATATGNPTLTIWIMRPNAAHTQFTPIQSATVACVVGTNTWTSADFGTLTLAYGDKVGLTTNGTNTTLRYNATGALYKYWTSGTSGALTIGTPYNFTLGGSNVDLQYNYSIANATLGIERANVGSNLTSELNSISTNVNIFKTSLNNDSNPYGINPLLNNYANYAALPAVTIVNDNIENISGTLGSITLSIATISTSPTVSIYIMRPNAAKTQWTPQYSGTVSVSSTGNKTFTSADFGNLVLAIGDKIGISSSNCTVRFLATANGALYKYWTSGTSGALTIGTAYNFSLSPTNNDFQFQYTIKNKTIGILESQLSSTVQTKLNADQTAVDLHNKSLGTSILTSTMFSSNSPIGWTTIGSWSNTFEGLLSSSPSSIDYSNKAFRPSEHYNNNVIVGTWRYIPQSTGTRAGFGFIPLINIATNNGTMLEVDDVNHLLKFKAAFTSTLSGTTELTTISSVSIGSLVSGREYKVTLSRNFGVFTATLIDCVTTNVIGTLDYGSNLVKQDGWAIGNCNDTPCAWALVGQILIKSFSLHCPVNNPLVLITGDSTTMGTGASPTETWANRVIADLGGRGINCGQLSAKFTKISPEISSILSKLKPKWIIMNLGFNQAPDTTAFRTAVNDLKTWADANGARVAIVVQWHRGSFDDMTNMIAAQLRTKDVVLIRGDIAISVEGDAATPDNSKMTDGLHLNPLGNTSLYERVKIDLSELFY